MRNWPHKRGYIMKVFSLFIFMFTANVVIGADSAFFPQDLKKKIEGINKKNKGGQTPLFIISVLGNSPETVQLLIDNGADVNIQDDDGDTPLMGAVCYNNERSAVKIVEVLVQNRADINVQDDGQGWTAGHCALGKENWDILLTFLSEDSFDLFIQVDGNDWTFLDMLATKLDILDLIQDMKQNMKINEDDEDETNQGESNEMFKDILIQAIHSHIQEKRADHFNENTEHRRNKREKREEVQI